MIDTQYVVNRNIICTLNSSTAVRSITVLYIEKLVSWYCIVLIEYCMNTNANLYCAVHKWWSEGAQLFSVVADEWSLSKLFVVRSPNQSINAVSWHSRRTDRTKTRPRWGAAAVREASVLPADLGPSILRSVGW